MKLTAEDKSLLRQLGYADKDFPQIESAMQARHTKYKLESKAISHDRAIALLGRQEYLLGLARSAFHYTAARTVGESEKSSVVYFDSSRLTIGIIAIMFKIFASVTSFLAKLENESRPGREDAQSPCSRSR